MEEAKKSHSYSIHRLSAQSSIQTDDQLALEEPLEVRVGYLDSNQKRVHKTISITMRTPGNDSELAAGFLFTEGIIKNPHDINSIENCGFPKKNVVKVEFKENTAIDFKRLERHFYTSSSCGICGKTSIEALKSLSQRISYPFERPIPRSLVFQLPEILRRSQDTFDKTGGLHASGLFTHNSELIGLREDVGRHNALDKLIGHAFLNSLLPLKDTLLLLSGRASFELIQKASMAGIPFIAAIGAPSSLAVELAKEMNITLVGFVRPDRLNIYSGEGRVL